MKRQIRQNVFETNSSSMHSLVVKKQSEYFTEEEVLCDTYVDQDGLINMSYSDDLYFGRTPFQVLTRLIDKAKYVLASMSNFKGDSVYNEVADVIRSYIPEFKDFNVQFKTRTYEIAYYPEEEIKVVYGDGNYVKKDDYWVVWGYDLGEVDEDILSQFLKNENISITEFLKNKRYIVIVDGDEYCIYKNMKKNGLINTDEIEKEYEKEYTLGYWEANDEEAN